MIDGAAVRRGRSIVLRVEHLEIGPGVTAVVGPNGSGKSSLLSAIAGLLDASGEISVLGGAPDGAHRHVAYVLQAQHASEHLLVTAGEVVALGRSAELGAFGRMSATDRSIIEAAMDRLDVRDLARRHLADMSGGQRQRVFVAQGLAQRAEILLLDEPVAGLDIPSAQRIRAAIAAERSAGRTVIVATHDLAEAAHADLVVLLSGRVVAAGRPDEVLTPEHLRVAYGGRVLELGDRLVAIDDAMHHEDFEHYHHEPHHDDPPT